MSKFKNFSIIVLILIVITSTMSCKPHNTVKTFSSDGSCWEVGYACKEIIPDIKNKEPYYLGGYRNGNIAEDILDNPCVKAVYIEISQKSMIVLTVDCIGLFYEDIKVIEEEFKKNISQIVK